jgi:hypothetical protein
MTTNRTPRYQLESTGIDTRVHGAHQRALSQIGGDIGALREQLDGASSYEAADSADWSGNPPTTLAEALDRIAAALGPIA